MQAPSSELHSKGLKLQMNRSGMSKAPTITGRGSVNGGPYYFELEPRWAVATPQ